MRKGKKRGGRGVEGKEERRKKRIRGGGEKVRGERVEGRNRVWESVGILKEIGDIFPPF